MADVAGAINRWWFSAPDACADKPVCARTPVRYVRELKLESRGGPCRRDPRRGWRNQKLGPPRHAALRQATWLPRPAPPPNTRSRTCRQPLARPRAARRAPSIPPRACPRTPTTPAFAPEEPAQASVADRSPPHRRDNPPPTGVHALGRRARRAPVARSALPMAGLSRPSAARQQGEGRATCTVIESLAGGDAGRKCTAVLRHRGSAASRAGLARFAKHRRHPLDVSGDRGSHVESRRGAPRRRWGE